MYGVHGLLGIGNEATSLPRWLWPLDKLAQTRHNASGQWKSTILHERLNIGALQNVIFINPPVTLGMTHLAAPLDFMVELLLESALHFAQ